METIIEEEMLNNVDIRKSYGKIHFTGGANRETAKFAKIDVNSKIEHIFDLFVKKWKLGQPRLVVSVTGSATSFTLNPELKNWFTVGILKIVGTPGTWVITGGTNSGIMKYVGETLQGFSKACIGIGAWGTIANTEKLRVVGEHVLYEVEYSLGSNVAFLDPNHTHHLLVDDGSFQSFGAELKLRSKLELYINKRRSLMYIRNNTGPRTEPCSPLKLLEMKKSVGLQG